MLLAPSEFIKFTSRCLLSVMSLSNSDILVGSVKVYALSSIMSGNCRINGSTIFIISFLLMSSFSYLVLSIDISIGFISIELFIFVSFKVSIPYKINKINGGFMSLSNTATPKYYGEFRNAVMRGDILVCKEIAMEMNRIDDLINNPGVY